MSKSKIEWTEVTWNPVTGCNKISPGCKNCYAETIANRFWDERKFTDVICHEDRLEKPFFLKKPRMIFVNSMSDLFHEKVSFEFIEKVINVMAIQPRHTYQVLTKRPERLLEYCEWQGEKIKEQGFDHIDGKYFEFPDFIWIGVSVENQEMADKRIPLLLQVPAKVRWLSVEPMLSGINLFPFLISLDVQMTGYKKHYKRPAVNWVVVGAESGPKARPMDIRWAIDIKNQCNAAGVKFFMKQICENGRKIPYENFPSELKIREYPI